MGFVRGMRHHGSTGRVFARYKNLVYYHGEGVTVRKTPELYPLPNHPPLTLLETWPIYRRSSLSTPPTITATSAIATTDAHQMKEYGEVQQGWLASGTSHTGARR